MFALKAGRDGASRTGTGILPDGLVLPRWFRKPVRFASRLISGNVQFPPFMMLALSTVMIGGFGSYGVMLGGHFPTIVQGVTARTGFAVEEIRVSGNNETSEIDIFDRVGLDGWTSLVGLDVQAARMRIEGLPWVEDVAVRKIYPATLEVTVSERVPFAIWQRGSLLSLIERDGEVIAPLSGSRHLSLPLVVGAGASSSAADFIEKVSAVPELAGRVRGYVRISERRWDLYLDNGITIKLPENGEDAAIAALIALDKEKGLLSRDVEVVDMRLPDRLVVKLTSAAASSREAAMKKHLGRNYRPAERRI